MDGKFLIGAGAILSGGAYVGGAFDSSDYVRVVGASPIEVRAALQDLDIRDAPGEPGTDPSRSGGVAPLFELTEQGNDLVWTVRSGNDVAIRMIAHLEPVDGGTRTRVTTSVERGSAPDDRVAPAFRSPSVTAGLFIMVLEDQLDDLTSPPSPGAAACRALEQELLHANAPPPDQQIGFAGVARTAITLSAVEGQLKAAGCDTGFKKEFTEVSDELGDPAPRIRHGRQFDPAKPMVDARPPSERD